MDPHRHRAFYDENGNIILPPYRTQEDPDDLQMDPPLWQVEQGADEDKQPEAPAPIMHEDAADRQRSSILLDARAQFMRALAEGKQQYAWSVRSAGASATSAGRGLRFGLKNAWVFLAQPVWVPRRRKEPKQYSRGVLFVMDTVRFGGTFATIFSLLFVALNYQSFWSIVTTHLNPIDHVRTIQALTASVDTTLKEKLMRSPTLATAGIDHGDLLSYLPPVGPPENRLIIPKLGLNIPLVTPSFDALLREDWIQVEQDIQDALQYGVVHYPGTAKPGQAGNFFVTGHSSYYPWAPGRYKNVFARLHELEPGDEYWVYYGGDRHRFIVRSKYEVKPSNVDVLDQPVNKRVGTLMTCTPIGTTLRRLIISSEEVDPSTGIALEVGKHHQSVQSTVRPQALPI